MGGSYQELQMPSLEEQQLQTFITNLAPKPYCSNDLQQQGLLIRSKRFALTYKHIQHNPPVRVAYIVLDVDHPFSLLMLQEQVLPTPNFIVTNPKNGHAHIYYELETPVYTSVLARQKPLRYLASIEYALRCLWDADSGYSGLISKNPLHKHWQYKKLREEPWQLGELADWLTLPARLPRKAAQSGLGRNCTLFDMLRFWAYDSVLEFRMTSSFRAWLEAVRSAARGFNSFPDPLADNEVLSTAHSVGKWVWRNYTKRWSDAEFSEVQSKRGRLGGLKGGRGRSQADLDKRAKAHELRAQGMTIRAIAEELGCSKSAVGNWLK